MLLLFNLLLKDNLTFVIIWHILYHVLCGFSNDMLITNIHLILITTTTCCRSDISIFKALDSIAENSIVFPILYVFSLYLL